jgi:hypothetical protein
MRSRLCDNRLAKTNASCARAPQIERALSSPDPSRIIRPQCREAPKDVPPGRHRRHPPRSGLKGAVHRRDGEGDDKHHDDRRRNSELPHPPTTWSHTELMGDGEPMPALPQTGPDNVEALPPRIRTLRQQRPQLGAVDLPPRAGKSTHAQRLATHAAPPCGAGAGDANRVKRACPTSTTRFISAIASRHNATPSGVISYGWRRSSSASAAINPRSTSRPIAP